jgi:hypothetical protein
MPSSVKRHPISQHVRLLAPLPSPLDILRCLWGLRPKSNRFIARRGSDIVLLRSFHHIGYPRYCHDIMQVWNRLHPIVSRRSFTKVALANPAGSAGVVEGIGYPTYNWGVGFWETMCGLAHGECVYYCSTYYKAVRMGEASVRESDPKLQGDWCKPNHQPSGDLKSTQGGAGTREEPR